MSVSERVAWSLCLSVGHVRESCKNGRTDRDAVWKADLGVLKEGPCIRWAPIPQGEGAILALSAPIKSIGSLCCGVRKNGRTDRDAI